MKNYCSTSNMHSPVATLKRVPSAQVCRNAWKGISRYIFDIDKFIHMQCVWTLRTFINVFISPCPRWCRQSTCCTGRDARRLPLPYHCSQSPAKNSGVGNLGNATTTNRNKKHNTRSSLWLIHGKMATSSVDYDTPNKNINYDTHGKIKLS